jgi:hypothetical protein
MAPSKSVRSLVLDNLQATLQGMTDGNLYHYPVASASQVSIDPTVNVLTRGFPDLPFYVIEPTPEGDRQFFQSEQIKETFIVNITGRYDGDAADPTSKKEIWENLAADLEVALEADMTRGGHACDTRCMTPQPFTGVGSNVVIIVQPVAMTIYRRYGVPTIP